jgi:hypothetical protein
MAAAKGPRKIRECSEEFKLKAVPRSLDPSTRAESPRLLWTLSSLASTEFPACGAAAASRSPVRRFLLILESLCPVAVR